MLIIGGCAKHKVVRSNVLQAQKLPTGSKVLICEVTGGYVRQFRAKIDIPQIEIIDCPELRYNWFIIHSSAKYLINRFNPDATFMLVPITSERFYGKINLAKADPVTRRECEEKIRECQMRYSNKICDCFKNKHKYTDYHVHQYNRQGELAGFRIFGKSFPKSMNVDLEYDAANEIVSWLKSNLSAKTFH